MMSQPTPSDHKQLFTPKEMMVEAEKFALYKTTKTTSATLSLAMMAGVFIGLAFLFYITVTTGSSDLDWGLSRFVGGIAFSLGLIFIVLCGAELFTSSVLTSISLANRQINAKTMIGNWVKVYFGNFIGAIGLLVIVTAAGLYQLDHGQWGLNALNIAQHKLHHSPVQAFALGILCNLLVCLAIWLTFSTKNALEKSLLMMLPVAMFVSSGFEHCVANMFMVPLGIVIQNIAPESFWIQVGADPAMYADLTVYKFITANLIPVTLGNIVGGALLVGISKWSIHSRPELKEMKNTIKTTLITKSIKELAMNSNLQAKDIMTSSPLVLSAEMPIELAIDLLTENKVQGAASVDKNGRLVGFLSVHDVMVDLWCQDYIPSKGQKVVDLMSRDVVAIDVNESLVNIVEFLCIDKEQLYPTSGMGIATQLTSLSLEERAKSMNISKPQILPVLDNGVFTGIVSRMEVIQALRSIYGEKLDVVQKDHNLASA